LCEDVFFKFLITWERYLPEISYGSGVILKEVYFLFNRNV